MSESVIYFMSLWCFPSPVQLYFFTSLVLSLTFPVFGHTLTLSFVSSEEKEPLKEVSGMNGKEKLSIEIVPMMDST